MDNTVDYGPLKALIGTWEGDKGLDVAPEPDGSEESPYFETIVFTPTGEANNAEKQKLATVHYRQIVRRKETGEVFHDETGYWMWDAREKVVMHSLVIPRAVGLLAGGTHSGQKNENGDIVLEVSASVDSDDWGIVQSPFMQKNALTKSFKHKIIVNGNSLWYHELTLLKIYGRIFEHTDTNQLTRK